MAIIKTSAAERQRDRITFAIDGAIKRRRYVQVKIKRARRGYTPATKAMSLADMESDIELLTLAMNLIAAMGAFDPSTSEHLSEATTLPHLFVYGITWSVVHKGKVIGTGVVPSKRAQSDAAFDNPHYGHSED